MPIYEYRCTDCDHKLEALQRFSDAPLRTCPVCGKETLTKLVSAAGFQLKGSGWYQTDFRGSGSGKKPDTKTDAPAGEGAAAKTEKSDAKPSESAASSSDAGSSKPAAPASTPST
jgi:putative FmdB family regulatory protein